MQFFGRRMPCYILRNVIEIYNCSHHNLMYYNVRIVTLLIFRINFFRLCEKSCTKTRLDVSSVLGSVNDHYNSEQIIQGVLEDKSHWEKVLRRDLALRAHNPVVDRNVTEAVCIIGDMNSWYVYIRGIWGPLNKCV